MSGVNGIYWDQGGHVHNVMAYGALANGTDDTLKIQEAIDEAEDAGGGIVFFPRGTYRIDGTLTVPTDVTLQGINTFRYSVGSVLEYRGSGTAISIAGDRVAIRGIRVAKNDQTSGVTGIDTNEKKDLDFELVEVSGFQKGFDADNSFRVIWRRCNIQGAATSGSIGIFSSVNFNANLVQSCGFIAVEGTAWHPIDINRNSSGTSSGSVICDNDFGGGLATDGSSGLDFFAIDLGAGCQAFHVTGNRVETSGMGFLRQIHTAQGLTIVGNSIGGSDTASVARGIDIYGAGVEIGLNTWSQTTVAIQLNSTATRVTVAPQEVTNQVGTVLQNDSRNDLALRTYNDRTDAFANLGTTGQGVRGGGYLPQRSVTHFSLVTPQGHVGTFSIHTGLESNVGYRYTAVGAANCTVTQSTPGTFTISVQGTTTTYTLAYVTGVNTATLRASTSTTGTTLLVSHLIPLG
jgi:hypothetical protein